MVKKQYLKEIELTARTISRTRRNNRQDVQKIQSWLNLYARIYPQAATATAVDGDFGPATELALRHFQQAEQLRETGAVNAEVYAQLCRPMTNAFETPLTGSSLRELVIAAATLHMNNHAFELTIRSQSNSGPWVRSYMDGHEGNDWFWCMGFVQMMVDQAASTLERDFRNLMPLTYSCDTVGSTGINKKLLYRSAAIRSDPSLVQPGDIFLLPKASRDWFHTGVVVAVRGDVFETIEGNTNEDGSHNGIGVYKRTRNFRRSRIDVFSIEPLV